MGEKIGVKADQGDFLFLPGEFLFEAVAAGGAHPGSFSRIGGQLRTCAEVNSWLFTYQTSFRRQFYKFFLRGSIKSN